MSNITSPGYIVSVDFHVTWPSNDPEAHRKGLDARDALEKQLISLQGALGITMAGDVRSKFRERIKTLPEMAETAANGEDSETLDNPLAAA